MGVIGTVLRDRYEIITEIGKGGMSTVYLAKDKNLGSYWAVKQVKNNANVDIDAFKKEVELLSTLNHSDIPRIVDRIEINDDYFVIMDFVDGSSLGKLVLAEGPLPENKVMEWAKMLCDVLEYLHNVKTNPIIYRDMKPDNIMLTQTGRIKLIDFGIAKECKRGEKQIGANVGTKGYAAPEQYKGASNILDERSDIYSLGATLFYLVTGMTPGKPPKAIHPIRQINPQLSEGLEYIITKCTYDEPNDRYQNCRELREDLNNIQQLTGTFRNKMIKKLTTFCASLSFCILCTLLSFIGYKGVQAEQEDKFQMAFKEASNYDRQGDYSNAAKYYDEAVQYKNDDYETCILLFNALLPHTETNIAQTKSAIDHMRKRYIDNPNSGMYINSRLLYQIVKKCIEVNDPVYASFAVDYIKLIKESQEYAEGVFDVVDLECYEIIALNCSKNITTLDFEKLNEALINLEKNTDMNMLTASDKLDNYYSTLILYGTYPNHLDSAYNKIYEIGTKAKAIIDNNLESEDLAFQNIIPMYELVASSLYNSAIMTVDKQEKENVYLLCIEWFHYLEDMNADLRETLKLKKGNAYKGIFDIYNTVKDKEKIDNRILTYLTNAIEVYKEVIEDNPSSFLPYIFITQAYLEKELLRPANERDFTTVLYYYKKVLERKNSSEALSNIALSQFSSLKKQMKNAGLEG